ncbi:hypothetical protein HMPREF1868_00712 [Olsenella sp. DNF00959]|nr:hypothetical protein HMPREF1868_00712 [Olsenella sp. DNF00959]
MTLLFHWHMILSTSTHDVNALRILCAWKTRSNGHGPKRAARHPADLVRRDSPCQGGDV